LDRCAYVLVAIIKKWLDLDVVHGNQMLTRAMVIQQKTQRPVQFKLTEDTRNAVSAWITKANLKSE